jgi:acyl-CoA synthetase (AMP-forming)/AMP-acid ligase II
VHISTPEPLLFTEQLRKHAVHYGSKLAVIDAGGTLTFAELWEAITAVAGALRDAGAKPGERVATAMHPSTGHLVVLLGCMAAGVVPCPLNIRLTTAEFRRFLEPIAPALIIADPSHRAVVDGLGAPLLVLDEVDAHGPIRERLAPLWSERPFTAAVAETDVALIVPTGGTTGVPKGAISTHRGVYLWLASCAQNSGRNARDVELFFSPFFHISIVTGWMATLFVAGAVRILRSFSVEQSIEAISAGATFLMGAPTMFTALRRDPAFARLDRSSVSSISVGAMAATSEFIRQIMDDYPQARLKHGYGATEFGPVTGIVHEDFLEGRITGVGRALPGVRIIIADDNLRPLPPGEVGELVVSCPWRTVGYWGREQETADTFTPMGVRLGDLGRIDEQGWITIAGRKKEMIISGGENVFPNEVEAVLARHPSVQDISVYGVRDDYWGERVEAAVVLQPGRSLSQAELADFGRAELGGYKLPKTLRFVEAIPLTPNNKPDRRRLSQEADAVGVK